MYNTRTEWEEFLEHRKSKSAIFALLVILGFTVIVIRLWHLQIIQHSALSDRAENNRIRQVTLDGRRGKILDRNGDALVDSRPSFQLSVIPEDLENPKKTLELLNRRVEFDMEEKLEEIKKARSFESVVIKRDITREQVAFAEERRLDLPGVHLEIKAIRNYIHNDIASHLLGYLSIITPKQLARDTESVYSRNDFVGQYGIEKKYEQRLRGRKGLKRIEVDATGRQLKLLGQEPPKSGEDLRITIDYKTQAAAEKAFEGKMGAAMAIDPDTGEILAYVSKPSFDPNTFALGITAKDWKSLVKDEFHPLQNRLSQGQYPPGSTFKIVVAAAALEEGIINESSTFYCPGHFRLGRRTYRCWKRGGHGSMTVRDALIQSCDVFFYNAGLKLGINKIARYANIFGLGRYPKINIGPEKKGLMPTTQWKKKYRKESWIKGETVSCSIGQGFVLTTPAQQARMIAAVANGGTLVPPRIIPGQKNKSENDSGREPMNISPNTIRIIREALRGVVAAPHGTAWRLRNGPYSYAGKTGTSQVIQMKKDDPVENKDLKLKFRDHAWFVSFAPYDDPKIAVAVIAEHAGHGGEAAAPIAQRIMDAYLDGIEKTGAEKQIGAGDERHVTENIH
ncbi:Peptidoglycan D,D-transpeptidase MrdA [hydrothermal vent metagenome]|uniref:Peptidoglycan D,D-transpeptidase MrdA n=1 Tax=hydrothermal vent metagenome TaxID=652676 RepID=A0A3B1BWJ0_9ZZZZ